MLVGAAVGASVGAGDGGEQYVASHSEHAACNVLRKPWQQLVWAAEHTLHTLVSALQTAVTVGAAVGADVAVPDPTKAKIYKRQLYPVRPRLPRIIVGFTGCAKQGFTECCYGPGVMYFAAFSRDPCLAKRRDRQ